MAAVSGLALHDASPRYLPRHRFRLGVAIVLSALVHIGFADRMMAGAPRYVAPRSPAIISARIEIPVTPQLVLSPLQNSAEVAHQRVPDPQQRNRPADENAPRRARDKPLPPAVFLEKTQDARIITPAPPPVSDPVYYPAHQLDVYPALVRPVNLDFPREVSIEQANGRALLQVMIDETGGVRELSIIEAGPARVFENLIHAAFLEARFSPARKDGRAVKSRVLISVDYGR